MVLDIVEVSIRGTVNALTGEIVESKEYMPSGILFRETYSENQSRGFCGKEKLMMHGFNVYDSDARLQYGKYPGFMSMDPLCQNSYSISPYVYCGNNPVSFIDPNGREFTQAAWVYVNKLIADINRRQAANSKAIAKHQAKLDSGGLSAKRSARLQRRIDRSKNNSSELESARSEIATLAGSKQKYDIRIDNSMNSNADGQDAGVVAGGARFNFDNDNFDILLKSNSSLGMLAHELKHAYQFETGALSTSNHRDGSPFYDQSDEWEAYSRGALFGGEHVYSLPSNYNVYQEGPVDATNHPNIMHFRDNPAALQRFVNRQKYRMAFRINGVTYRTQ